MINYNLNQLICVTGKEVVDYAWSVVGDKVTKVILDLVNKALAS